MTSLRTHSLTIFIAIVLLGGSGCVPLMIGAAAGAGGVAWVKGALQHNLSKPIDRVYSATIDAMKDMNLPLLINNKDGLTAKIESELADGRRIWIDMEKMTGVDTKISIRIGAMGDQVKSREILSAITSRL